MVQRVQLQPQKARTPSKRQQRRERRQHRLEVTQSQPEVEITGRMGGTANGRWHTFRWCQQCPAPGLLQSSKHRESLRLICEKIRELESEFQDVLELYGAVVRLVSRSRSLRHPGALDKK